MSDSFANNEGTIKAGSGANLVTMDDNGILLSGTARVSKTLVLTLGLLSGGGINPPDEVLLSGYTKVLAFDDNIEEEVFGNFLMPDDYENGSDLQTSLLWSPSDNAAGNIVWVTVFDLIRPNSGGTIGGTPITLPTTVPTPSNNQELISTPGTTVPGTGFEKGDLINFRFFRDATNVADTYVADAFVSVLLVNYTSNAMGA